MSVEPDGEATRAATLDMMRGMTAIVEPVLQLAAAAWVRRERPGGGSAALNIAADTQLMHGAPATNAARVLGPVGLSSPTKSYETCGGVLPEAVRQS